VVVVTVLGTRGIPTHMVVVLKERAEDEDEYCIGSGCGDMNYGYNDNSYTWNSRRDHSRGSHDEP
jgi:hypothetical protein